MQSADAGAYRGVPHDCAGADVAQYVRGHVLRRLRELVSHSIEVQLESERGSALGPAEGSEGCGREVPLALPRHVHLDNQDCDGDI